MQNLLTQSVKEYCRLEFPRGTELFTVDWLLVGHPLQPNASVSPNRCLAVRHVLNAATNRIQIIFYTTIPLTERFRVMLVDWDSFPRSRAVMGYLYYGILEGIVNVSDYRMSLARQILPDILKQDTVYMLGIRFSGIPHSIHFKSIITDREGTEYIDWITVTRFSLNGTRVWSDRNLSMRPNHGNELPIHRPTVVRSRENPQSTENLQEIHEENSSQAIVLVAVGQVSTTAQVSQAIVAVSNSSVSRAILPFIAPVTPVAVVHPLRETDNANAHRNYPDRPENQRNQPIAGPSNTGNRSSVAGPSNTTNRRSTGINVRGRLLNTPNQRPLPPPAELEYDTHDWPVYDERMFDPNDE